MQWLFDSILEPNFEFKQLAQQHQHNLKKPKDSLGKLEELAIHLAAMQQTEKPQIDTVWVSIFAADHGIANESVSAFPQFVTAKMVKNLVNGKAAINILSDYIKAHFEIIDTGLLENLNLDSVIVDKPTQGTANFLQQPAMTVEQLEHALNAGKNAVERSLKQHSQLFIGGEIGIANTTSASACAAALLNEEAFLLTGVGTGLDDFEIRHKAMVIELALMKHQDELNTPLDVLQHLGGFEIAALVGAYIYAAQKQLPVLVDGFISSVASLIACKINPLVKHWCIYAHQSKEKGHKVVLKALGVTPLLNLEMNLGEGSGAVSAVPLLQMACSLHNKMATLSHTKTKTKSALLGDKK